jgi:hypothetical protein
MKRLNCLKYCSLIFYFLITFAGCNCKDNMPNDPVPIACSPDLFLKAVRWELSDGGNGHLYEVVLANGNITWEDAQKAATARGDSWHLATITSAAENNFVESLIAGKADCFNCCQTSSLVGRIASGPWLGATASTNTSKDWKWVTGEAFAFTDWGPFEPFGNGNHISYAEFGNSRQIAWNDIPSGHSLSPQSYILECSGVVK